ncbi:MAG: NADH-quinone oxidoreductase subunit I [candidate division NC10 bacterium]|nr:NADH-quinone oxidoreductase subunit I [candidate division NC10 bacterium]MDE2322047.1 NADH-quinone oxidoreductase subunit I [candidate division NC10 bacterium]
MGGYFSDLFGGSASILRSLWVTLRYLFTPAITVQYPDEQRTQPLRALNRHVLRIDETTGQLKCTACEACARICPTRCIELTGTGKGKNRHPSAFSIDHNLCMYCNLCVEVCPFDAITMWTRIGELSAPVRSGLVFDLKALTAERFYPSPTTPEKPVPPAVEPEPEKAEVAAPAPSS